MRFTPARVQIELGDSVIWEAGDDGHTVTARDGTFDSSSRGLMAEGDQFRWRFRVPGTYAYFCRVHQNRGMQGEIVVVDPSGATTTTRLTPVTAAATTSTTAALTTTTAAGHDHQPGAGHQFDDEPAPGDQHHGPPGSAGSSPGAARHQPQRPGPQRFGYRHAPRGAGRRPPHGG